MEPVGFYRGDPVYDENPSLKQPLTTTNRLKPISRERMTMIGETSGEVMGRGYRAFYEEQEVDPHAFIKLYVNGVQNITGLSKSGLLLFTLVHREMVASRKSRDQIALSQIDAAQNGLSRGQFYRGLRELLDAGFLYRTKWPSVFFVNVLYIFRGNRLAFFRGYRKAEAAAPPPALSAAEETKP